MRKSIFNLHWKTRYSSRKLVLLDSRYKNLIDSAIIPPDLDAVALGLRRGDITSAALTRQALAAALDPAGQGQVVFTRLYRAEAGRAAAESDARRTRGAALSPLDGVPISIKDLFDVAGEPTMAGSAALRDAPPAVKDATVVRRLREAGAVIVGKTVMTEFALSCLGMNPHLGTPLAPWERARGHVPGGSSSGAAVSVSDGMALAAIGSDTGGSVRVPAAFCGLVGFKPTAARVSRDGVFALSSSLDSIGPIAHTVGSCALIDQVLSGESGGAAAVRSRLGIPRQYVLDSLDAPVAGAFTAALARLESAGAQIVDMDFPELETIPQLGTLVGLVPVEGYGAHAALFEAIAPRCDPRVMNRFLAARDVSPAAYAAMLRLRGSLISQAEARMRGFDALLFPTASLLPPTLQEMQSDTAYFAANGRAVRNAAVANILDLCALSIPCHAPGAAPVGLTFMGAHNADRTLLAMARPLEPVVRGA